MQMGNGVKGSLVSTVTTNHHALYSAHRPPRGRAPAGSHPSQQPTFSFSPVPRFQCLDRAHQALTLGKGRLKLLLLPCHSHLCLNKIQKKQAWRGRGRGTWENPLTPG